MTDFPQSVLLGQAAIKLIIDFAIKPLITEKNKIYLPGVAMALGLARSLAFMGENLEMAIYWGLIMGVGAIGVNEVSKLPSEIKKTI